MNELRGRYHRLPGLRTFRARYHNRNLSLLAGRNTLTRAEKMHAQQAVVGERQLVAGCRHSR